MIDRFAGASTTPSGRHKRRWGAAAIALLSTGSGAAAKANGPVEELVRPAPDESGESERRSPFHLHFSGYGDIQFAFHDFGPNQNREGGSQADKRLVFDATRFVLEVEGETPFGLEFEAEIEFEHGGTGAAMELEYEEFGEFEQEVQKGGEVLLEEFQLKKSITKDITVALGRFYVAMGLLSGHHLPTDYLAVLRSEAETTVIPAVWDEMGIQCRAQYRWLRLTAQLVNGLDSTGFSSQRWIASGHQSRFEQVRATDLAGVGRLDLAPAANTEFGFAAYFGGTSRNRPKADLVRECAEGNSDATAPCGYLAAPLFLIDAHGRFQWGRLRGSALALWGRLGNAEAVSNRNERLSNALNALRTPVADEALAVWGEVGVDVAPWMRFDAAHRIEPFVRADRYDTMFGTRDSLFDNPRFDRTVFTGGVAYTFSDALVFKFDAGRRRFGSAALNPENSIRLSAGFVY